MARNYGKERLEALVKQKDSLLTLVDSQRAGSMSEEVVRLAQALVLCTLPHSPTTDIRIEREARLGDGTKLYVTFSAVQRGVAMPYGSDRKLLAWIIDRAIRNNAPFVAWETAQEYLSEIGLARSGKNNRDLQQRLTRLAGLVVAIKREGSGSVTTQVEAFFRLTKLPKALALLDQEMGRQLSLPIEGKSPYGVTLNPNLFEDIRRHYLKMPRELWLQTEGSSAVQDLILWLFYRCSVAQTETVVPWSAMAEQFPQDASKPHRIREHMREAINQMRTIWPHMKAEILDEGVWIGVA